MPIKLVCFDLDGTLLNGRLNHSLEEAGLKEPLDDATLSEHLEKIGGIKNRMALQRTIKDLLKNGTNIAITSFSSHPSSVDFVLRRIGLDADEIVQIHNVSLRPPHEERKQFGKNNHLQRAIESFGPDIQPSEVVLVDDNIQNFELAKQKGYQVIWVQGSENDVGYLNELRELAGLSKPAPALQISPAELPKQSWVDKVLGWFGLQRIPAPSR